MSTIILDELDTNMDISGNTTDSDVTLLYDVSDPSTNHISPPVLSPTNNISYNTFSAEEDISDIILNEQPDLEHKLSKYRLFALNLCWYGLSVMFLVLSIQVIPSQIEAMVGESSKGRWLGVLVASGAMLTFITSPLIGMFSDRLLCRHGRRRPVMLVGALFLCLGAGGMAFSASDITVLQRRDVTLNDTTCDKDLEMTRCAPYMSPMDMNKELDMTSKRYRTHWQAQVHTPTHGNIGVYLVFYLIVTSAFSSITVPYNALIADMSHPSQRGLCSGIMGAMILLGNVSGAALGVSFTHIGVLSIYGCIMGTMVVCLIITIVTTPEKPGKLTSRTIGCREIVTGYYMPLKQHDFRWVFITRLLMQQGIATITEFLEFWLSDMIHLPNCWTPQTSVALLLLPLLFSAAISSVVCGVISDKLERRKPLVFISAILMCFTSSVLAFIHGQFAFITAIAMAFLFGIGFGSFQAVDFALVMDVLPEEKDKAKDIAVWHQAMVLPQALATPIGGIILDVFESVNCLIGLGYIILFLVTSFYFFLSGVFVTRIKSVK